MLIVQITDMHVSKPGKLFGNRLDSREAFQRCVTRVLSLRPEPDVVLLTGDLTENGEPQEYDFVAEQLQRLRCPVIAIPGNHDVREEMLRKLPQCVAQQSGGHLSIANDRFALRIVGLDTITPGQVHGEICAERLSWLRDTLRDSDKPTLIAMHHPPFKTGFAAMDNYGIKQGLAEFRQIVSEHAKNIKAIVCGHVHRSIVSSISGVPVQIAPCCSLAFVLDLGDKPSLQFAQEPQQFLVHSYSEEAGLVSHAAFVDEFPSFPLRS